MRSRPNRVRTDYLIIFALIALLVAGACGVFGPCYSQKPVKRDLAGRWQVENSCAPVSFGGQQFFTTTELNISGHDNFDAVVSIFSDDACKDLAAVSSSVMTMAIKSLSDGNYLLEYEADLNLTSLHIEFKENGTDFRTALAHELSCDNTDITKVDSLRVASTKMFCDVKGVKIVVGMSLYQHLFLGQSSLDLADFREQFNPAKNVLLPAFTTKSDAMKSGLMRFLPMHAF